MPGGKGGSGAEGGYGYFGAPGAYGLGGGGGGGAGGGKGGAGGGGQGAAGGAGGTAASPNGQAGGHNYDADGSGLGGGGGGGGGFNGNGSGSKLANSHGALRGGAGGAGGYGYYGGGGGGAGGFGAVSSDANGARVSVRQGIVGGVGGAGGKDAFTRAGNGGDGGDGVYFQGAVVLTSTALIRGGSGGAGGVSSYKYGGAAGQGGYGIFAIGGLTIRNTSTIQGGAGGAGGGGSTAGGNGGAGGTGIFGYDGPLTITNSGRILGGAGGRGAGATAVNQIGSSGNGGDAISGFGLSVTNSGLIQGGAAGGTPGGAYAAGGSGIYGSGTINNQSGAAILGGVGYSFGVLGHDLTIVNSGTISGRAAAIDVTGGTNSLTLGGQLNGEIHVDNGATLEFKSSGTLSDVIDAHGTLAAAAGTVVTVSGEAAGPTTVYGMAGATGSFVFAKGSTLSSSKANFVAGRVTFDSGARIDALSLDIDGAGVILAASRAYGGTFTLDAGYINLGAYDLTLYKSAAFGGGAVGGSGKLSALGTSTLDAATVVNGKATLVDAGTLTAKAKLSLDSEADLLVAAKGTYILSANASIGAQTANDTITNQGLINKVGGGKSLVTAAVTNTGTLEASSGTLDLTKDVSGKGTLEMHGTSTLELGGIIAASQTTKFDTGNILQLDNAANFHATIAGFAFEDAITLTGFSDMAKLLYQASTDTLSVSDGSRHFSTHLDGTYQARYFNLTHVKGGETIHYSPPV